MAWGVAVKEMEVGNRVHSWRAHASHSSTTATGDSHGIAWGVTVKEITAGENHTLADGRLWACGDPFYARHRLGAGSALGSVRLENDV